MPELPEVETWRRLADRTATGHRIVKARSRQDLKIFDRNAPASVTRALTGATITGTCRHGKHLWLTFDRPGHLYLHFGMTGSLWALQAEEDAPSHAKLELILDTGTRLVYRNLRRIGRVRWLEDAAAEPPVSKLGPDPLGPEFTVPFLLQALSGRSSPIKAVLLNQAIFAGVGNWIADEILYQMKISPHHRACDLESDQVKRLHSTILDLLNTAVGLKADATKFPKGWLFHSRWGKKAKTDSKGNPLTFDQVGGRTTAWAPGIQT